MSVDKAEQRRIEREKRQARIRESQNSRLSKITGAAGTKDYKEPVQTPQFNALTQTATEPAKTTQPTAQPVTQPAQTNAQSVKSSTTHTNKLPEIYFETIRFAFSVLVGLYAAFKNPYAIMSVFLLTELMLFTIQIFFGRPGFEFKDIPLVSPFLSMLPKTRQNQLKSVLVALKTARNAYFDFAVVVVVYGIASWGGIDFIRPQASKFASKYACSSC